MIIRKEYRSPEVADFEITVERGFKVSMGFNAGFEGADGDRASNIDDMNVSADNESW